MKNTLEELLEEVSRLFRDKDVKKPKLSCFDFSLDKMPYGWGLKVTNDWHKWHKKGYETSFGYYARPEYAVEAFLAYVRIKKINVRKLMD